MQFSALISYMLRHIELKFCIWLCFTVLQSKFECHQFPSIFVGVMPLLELRILKIQFSALFSYMLWLIELKFCIWLCFTVLQIKFECRLFASIFIRPSSDGTYYGMVMSVRPFVRPSGSPSVRLSVRPGLRPPVFHTFLKHALDVRLQTGRIMV